MIVMKFVDGVPGYLRERLFKYKTEKWARRAAVRMVGDSPRKDPDGYAVSKNGNCLFFVNNCTFESMFPIATVMES